MLFLGVNLKIELELCWKIKTQTESVSMKIDSNGFDFTLFYLIFYIVLLVIYTRAKN